MKLVLLYLLAAFPGAFVGLSMGSVAGYEREFKAARRNHQERPESHPILRAYEGAGVILGSLPGIAVVWYYKRKAKREGEL